MLPRETWPRATNLWETYDEQGNLERSVQIEAQEDGYRPYLFHASRKEVWVQIRGALDVPYVVRYELRPSC